MKAGETKTKAARKPSAKRGAAATKAAAKGKAPASAPSEQDAKAKPSTAGSKSPAKASAAKEGSAKSDSKTKKAAATSKAAKQPASASKTAAKAVTVKPSGPKAEQPAGGAKAAAKPSGSKTAAKRPPSGSKKAAAKAAPAKSEAKAKTPAATPKAAAKPKPSGSKTAAKRPSGGSKATAKAPASKGASAKSDSKAKTPAASAKAAPKPSDSKTAPKAASPKASAKRPAPAKKPADPKATAAKPSPAAASKPAPGAKPPAAKKAAKPRASDSSKKLAKRSPLPGPEIKRAAKKAPKGPSTQERVEAVEQPPQTGGRRPLDGIRVLDLTRLLPGPYASHILASFGADVIKVERPGEGDYIRENEPKVQDVNAVYSAINRGKKSLAIDLKHPDGKEAFRALVKRSDVVIDGFRPDVMKRLELDYERLREINPKLIYAALTGFGRTGRNAQRAGHDLNYIAYAGMLDLLGESGGMPAVPGVQIGDIAAGALPTVIGILLALQHRSRVHVGQLVDVSIFESLLGLMPVQVANYAATKRRPKRGHERLFGRYACYNVYPVRNGRYISVAALEPKFWKALCVALEREDLIEDQYVEGDSQQILIAEMTRIFQKKEINEWMEIFEGRDVCVAEVREISRVLQDESLAERGMVLSGDAAEGGLDQQLGVFPKLSEAPGYIEGAAPRRGEHTRQILISLKIPAKRVNEMLSANVAEQPAKD